MDPLAIVLILVAFGLAVLVVVSPLRAGRAEADVRAEVGQLADLETAKEAKYREIRDAELDYRTGKLSEADWRAVDRELRAEAMDLLHRLDAVTGAPTPDSAARGAREA